MIKPYPVIALDAAIGRMSGGTRPSILVAYRPTDGLVAWRPELTSRAMTSTPGTWRGTVYSSRR